MYCDKESIKDKPLTVIGLNDRLYYRYRMMLFNKHNLKTLFSYSSFKKKILHFELFILTKMIDTWI